ncbi:MAG: hypothetical protein CM15mV3_1880 [Caudoviricetes sp.]|nr:MAG: hypothetical protein CM15mV3_1880 [Caudoviricetes sp.]
MSKILANEIANYGDNAPIDLKEGLNIPAGKPLQAAGNAGSSGQVLSSTGTSIAWVQPLMETIVVLLTDLLFLQHR